MRIQDKISVEDFDSVEPYQVLGSDREFLFAI